MWFYADAGPLEMSVLEAGSRFARSVVLNRETPQVLVPADTWMAARAMPSSNPGVSRSPSGRRASEPKKANTDPIRIVFPPPAALSSASGPVGSGSTIGLISERIALPDRTPV
jgi:hypothetical protein